MTCCSGKQIHRRQETRKFVWGRTSEQPNRSPLPNKRQVARYEVCIEVLIDEKEIVAFQEAVAKGIRPQPDDQAETKTEKTTPDCCSAKSSAQN